MLKSSSEVFGSTFAIYLMIGFPLVRVPVLSNTKVVIEEIFSSMSPPFIRIPYLAAMPVPTITAVGVARPRAQGHAITKVEMPNWKANSNAVWF
jgi:hypothetical protein